MRQLAIFERLYPTRELLTLLVTDCLCGQEIEVFALPGYKEKPGHYIYSGTSATDAAQKTNKSLRQFLHSKSLLAVPHKDFSFGHFTVEKSDLAIIGYPSTVVFSYWVYQLSKGNLALVPILNALGSTSLDLMADKQFNSIDCSFPPFLNRINRSYVDGERCIHLRTNIK